MILSFAAVPLIVFSHPVVSALYGTNYTYAPLMLQLTVVGVFSTLLGIYNPYLISIGDTRLIGLLGIVNTLMYMSLGTLLIVNYGAWGLVINGTLVNYLGNLISLLLVKRRYGVLPDLRSNLRSSAPSLIPGLLLYPIVGSLQPTLHVLLLLPLYVALFLILVPVFMRRDELDELMRLSNSVRILGPILSGIIRLVIRLKEMAEK
jgi:O-antigen/teichoic acid export membrane protein